MAISICIGCYASYNAGYLVDEWVDLPMPDAELDAAVKYMDYIYSEEQANRFPDAYNLPLPVNGASMPESQPNVPEMLATSSENGTFTITDQAFPQEVADVLFNCQDAIAGGSMTPAEAAAAIHDRSPLPPRRNRRAHPGGAFYTHGRIKLPNQAAVSVIACGYKPAKFRSP